MSQNDAHLLIVDDDERIRALLGRFLRKNGFLVTLARDAAQARRLLAGLEFDLIVMDVMMPGEDGFALTRSLRERLTTPILLLTTMGGIDALLKSQELVFGFVGLTPGILVTYFCAQYLRSTLSSKSNSSAAQKQGAKAWETAKAYSGPVQGFLQTAAKQAGPVAKRVGESLGPLVQRLGPAGQKTVQFFASACWILLGC